MMVPTQCSEFALWVCDVRILYKSILYGIKTLH
jgi:hypothetical protein